MLLLIVILGAVCLVIAAVGYFATLNKELAEYRYAIVVSCMFAIAAVCIIGIFAYTPSKAGPEQSDTTTTATAPARTVNASVQIASADPQTKSSPSAGQTKSEDAPERPAYANREPGDIFRDCQSCPELVVVPSGDNNMGEDKDAPQSEANEYPLAWTRFRENYAVGRYEVTVREFSTFASATSFQPSGPCNTDGVGGKKTSFARPAFTQNPEHPVVCVSIADANKFVAWLSKKTGNDYALLSEARWEYARRAKTSVSRQAPSTEDEAREERGNIRGDNWTASTTEVGRFNANEFLLYDMMGNVAEWTNDCWLDNHMLRPKDGRAVRDQGNCDAHAVRGGSWDESARAARPASRRRVTADTRDWRIGFRIMRKIKPRIRTTQLTD